MISTQGKPVGKWLEYLSISQRNAKNIIVDCKILCVRSIGMRSIVIHVPTTYHQPRLSL